MLQPVFRRLRTSILSGQKGLLPPLCFSVLSPPFRTHWRPLLQEALSLNSPTFSLLLCLILSLSGLVPSFWELIGDAHALTVVFCSLNTLNPRGELECS